MDTRYKQIARDKFDPDSPKEYAVILKWDSIAQKYFVFVFITSRFGLIVGDPLVQKQFTSKWKAKWFFRKQCWEFQKCARINYKFGM